MSSDRTRRAPGTVVSPVVIDRVACTGHGVCAAVLPEHVSLDEWGYPILHPAGPVDPESGTAAVRLCPARALTLLPPQPARRSGR